MKFSIDQRDLLEGLQKVSGVVPAKSPTPVLENILFELDETALKITGTDLEVSVTTEVAPKKVDEVGAIALPARVLTEMMRSLPDIPIQFQLEEGNKLGITTDQGFYKISGISKDNFPEIPIPSQERVISMENQKLRRMLSKTIFAVSSDELRPALMGVFIQLVGNELRMVATDGHRLSKIVDTKFPTQDSPIKMIVPPKAVQIALKHLDGEGSTQLHMNESGLSFSFGKTTLFTRLVEGQYPDYERVIPRDNDQLLVADKNLLIASVKRVALFSSALTRQIRFSVSSGKLAVLSEDVDMGGEAREELSVDYQGESMEIGYNAQYVMDLIKHVDTDEVAFLLKSPINAALVSPAQQNENEDFHMLIMPIKLSS
ncbi:DNA polymerase III subunit beta [candidate division KSB1 bacterium]|nr:DNA polymerase III subunit beta [candidate division KSB1 bacterium]